MKENIHLPYDPANTLLGTYPREMKTYVQTNKQQQTNLYRLYSLKSSGFQELRIVEEKEMVVT